MHSRRFRATLPGPARTTPATPTAPRAQAPGRARWWRRSCIRTGFLTATLAGLHPCPAVLAQGVTTASIAGSVHARDGTGSDGTRVTVVNNATGFVVHSEVRGGRFVTHGLEIGGPYTIILERLGFVPERREGVFLRLGATLELHFELQPAVIPLDPVLAVSRSPWPERRPGTGTTVSDSVLHRLPTLNRNLYDFVRLAPQVSTRIGHGAAGMSGGGVGVRFNNFLINGVPQRSVPANQPPEFGGGRSIPLEAVSQYEILVAPFDVRYGDFAGALVNAVTRSGTNQRQGSVFAYARNGALARNAGAADSTPPYERLHYGFSLGGPLWRDRAHFFVASELQHLTARAPGPYVGQPTGATPPVPVSGGDLARLQEIMRGHGLEAGSGTAVVNSNPLHSVFARLDASLPAANSRVVAWWTGMRSKNLNFARPSVGAFPLSTHTATQATAARTLSLQVHTALPRAGGGHNEWLVSYRSAAAEWRPGVRQPIVSVAVPSTLGGAVTLVTGAPRNAHGVGAGFSAISMKESLALPLGVAHTLSLGVESEWFRSDRRGVANAFGSWTFANLDALAHGVAERFEVNRDFGSASVPMKGAHHTVHAGDEWRIGERIALTLGLRAEVLTLRGHPPYNPVVEAIFERRTDAMPAPRVHLSPRVGFTWDVSATGRDQLRGGVGVFTGRPPIAWLHSALSNYGDGIGVLRCGRNPADSGPAPSFVPDHRAPPTACATGAGHDVTGHVDLLDPRLRMAQTLRGVLAWDRRLPGDLLGTVEALVTRGHADFVFVNLNLAGPQAVDRHGRVLYGGFGETGLARPAKRLEFKDVAELRNTSGSRAFNLSARVEKRFSAAGAATAHYTFSRARDVQTPLRVLTLGVENWAAHAVSGRHDELRAGVSLNDVPHRVVLAGTRRAPWRRWPTEISVYYVGESGSPFTYVAWGAVPGRGDLNADGSNVNDPIYVPRDAFDPAEIRFAPLPRVVHMAEGGARTDTITAASQAAAFERFIEGTPCLRRQRGRILARNSCREPSSHTTILSVRQAVPRAPRGLEAQLDLYNVLNVLSRGWGQRRTVTPALLEHVGQSAGTPAEAQPIFRFPPGTPHWTVSPGESVFQLQLAMRYRF